MGNGFSPSLGFSNRKRLLVGLFTFLLFPLFLSKVAGAVSCTPGLASIIGTQYVADKCPGTSSTFKYTSIDLLCDNGTIKENSDAGGRMTYDLTPTDMQQMVLFSAINNSDKAFRNTAGTSFLLVGYRFVNGGKLDDKTISGSEYHTVGSSRSDINNDVFEIGRAHV
jgi:hypothetical protein